MPILNSVLATLYALYIVAGIYMFVTRGLSIVQLVVLAITVITILALTRRFGNWTRIVGLVYSSLMLFIGVTLIGFGVWKVVTDSSEFIAFVALGALTGAISAATIWALRAPASALEHDQP